MIEALCCGTPVIGFKTGGIPDAVQDGVTGRLVEAGDATAFGNTMVALAQDRQRTLQLQENCRVQMPQQYSLRRQAGQYVDLYEPLTARGAKSAPSSTTAHRVNEIFPSLLAIAQKRPRVRERGGFWRLLFRADD
jgi:glycogen synthase